MSSRLVRHSSFAHTHTNTHFSVETITIELRLSCRRYYFVLHLQRIRRNSEEIVAELHEKLKRMMERDEVSHFGRRHRCTGHNANGSVLTSVIDLGDLCSPANLHQAFGAIMTFTQTDYNFK